MNVLLAGLSHDRVELELARALAASGVRLQVVAQEDSPAVAHCAAHGIPVVARTFRHRLDRAGRDLLRALLEPHRFDLLHCLTNRALALGLQATRTLAMPPRILAYRGTVGHLSRWDPASRMAYLHPRVDAISCVSHAVRDYLRTLGIPDGKLVVNWKGHDPSWYTPAPRDALAAFGIPSDAVVACFAGNQRRVKGVDVLLKAMRRIPDEARLHLLLVGEMREARIARRAQALPNVHLAGFRADAAALAGACDMAVMPSIGREGLPKAVLEAMAQRRPAVVTRVGGLPELVVDGETGWTVPPCDPAALADALLALARDPAARDRMGQAARARIEGPFHIRHTVARTLALYERLCGAPQRTAEGKNMGRAWSPRPPAQSSPVDLSPVPHPKHENAPAENPEDDATISDANLPKA
jgi:L-malate glycosyltransferase